MKSFKREKIFREHRSNRPKSAMSTTQFSLARSLFCWSLLAFVAAICRSPAIAAEPERVTLAEDGKTDWQIRSVSPQEVPAKFAAAELQKYFEQISGAKLALVKEEDAGAEIVVGLRGDLSGGDRARLPASKVGTDGYVIAISAKPARVIIAGENARGVVYGVYDFLERLGCRWFYPTQDEADPEVVPQQSKVAIEPGAWCVASPFARRICNDDGWLFITDNEVCKKQVDWAMKNRYNMIGWQAHHAGTGKSLAAQYQELEKAGVLADLRKRGMTLHGPGHSFDQFLKSSEHFEKHPEWFGVRGGKRVPQAALGAQFCWSNAEARKEFVKNAAEFIAEAPLIEVFCTIPFDGGPACECEECKKAGASNLAMTLARELIDGVKPRRPDVAVEQVAGYAPLVQPPSDAKLIPPALRFVWAQWGRGHTVGYDDPRYNAQNLEAWRAAAGKNLTVCQYYGDNFSQPWIMGPFTTAIEGDRKYLVKNHVDAVYVLIYPAGYWWNHRLNCYLAGRCFYDASLDPVAEVRDFALHYFGPKAGPLLAEYYDTWGKNIELSYRVRGGATKQDRATLADQRKKLIEPAAQAVADDKVFAHRVGKVEKLHGLAESLAEVQRCHNEILRARKAGEFVKAERALKAAQSAVDATLSKFKAAAELNQGLVDRDGTTAFIKLVLENGIKDAAKAIAAKDQTIPAYFEPQLSDP